MRYQYLLHYVEGSLMPPLLVALILTVMKGPRIPLIVRPIVSSVADKLYAAFVKPNVTKHMAFLEGLLASAPGGGPYLCGEHLTAADILVSFPLEIAPGRIEGLEGRKSNLLSEYPRVKAYVERLRGEEGYKRAREKVERLETRVRSV
jgi:glutathione S-transferase